MKKLSALFIILSIILSLCACKPPQTPDGGDSGNTSTDTNTEAPSLSSINGVKLEDYVIVYSESAPDYNKRAAEYIASEIKARTGLELMIITDEITGYESEILVGETNREISRSLDADTEPLEFAILANGLDVALEADYFVIAAAAYYFIENYVPTDDFIANIPVDEVIVSAPIVKEARNFVMLIGDGMGVNQTLLYDYLEDTTDYSDGEDFFYGYMFPALGYSRTDSLSGLTDSAAGGTALSCGYKTENGYVGRLPDGTDLVSITELAGSIGKSTAVMSTETQTGATPASFSAHATDRSDSDDIRASQAALTEAHGTIIKCGFDYYTDRYMNNSIEKRVVDTLDALDNDEDGFFLMYEEAHIDKHSHDNDIEKTFMSLIRFNQVIARFMEYAFYHPDTLIIITADHETGGLYADTEGGELLYHTDTHTNVDVPIFAYGQGSELFDGKTMENTEIPKIIAVMMGVDSFGDQG